MVSLKGALKGIEIMGEDIEKDKNPFSLVFSVPSPLFCFINRKKKKHLIKKVRCVEPA